MAAARGSSSGRSVGSAGAGGGGGAGASRSHRLCRQALLPELDALVLDVLSRIRGFQERAMARNAIKVGSETRHIEWQLGVVYCEPCDAGG